MKLDLKALFGGDTQRIAIEEQLDFHDLQYGSYCPLRQPVRVTGQAYAKADVCYLDLDLSFVFDGVCDRCAEPIQKPMPTKMLCKPDCKGLCCKCGKNLNDGPCDCQKDVDPRLEALLQLLD